MRGKVQGPAVRPFDIGGLAIVDVVARLAVPGALAAVAHGAGNYALGAALTVTSLALLRGLWTGRAVERSFRDLWGAIVREAGRRSVVCLKSRPKEQAVAVLLSAAHDVARFRASVLPRALANGIGLLAVGGLLVWRLGMATAALAFGGLALLAALAGLIQLRLRRARVFSWDRFGVVARDVGALLDAAAELRAHGRQSSFMASLLLELRAMARAERQASTYGALLGLFPMGIGLVVLAIPLRGELGPLADLARLRGAAEAGLLGATALVLAVGLLQSAEEATQSAPCRRTIAGFLKPPPEDGSAVAGDGPLGKEAGDGVEPRRRASLVLREAEIELSRVSIVYRGSSSRTPAAVTHRWGPAEGLALLGDNGAGKSSLALAILGLLPIAEGELRFDGVAVSELDWAALRGEIAYLPQQPFVEPGASIGWHIRLLAGDGVSDAEIEAALERVGVLSVLTERAARAGVGVLELLAGELSGGQLRRVQLARIFVGDPELVVLDEPEAGLDAAGRRWLRALVTRLAPERRILLIAHDPGIVPEAFQTLECRALHGPA